MDLLVNSETLYRWAIEAGFSYFDKGLLIEVHMACNVWWFELCMEVYLLRIAVSLAGNILIESYAKPADGTRNPLWIQWIILNYWTKITGVRPLTWNGKKAAVVRLCWWCNTSGHDGQRELHPRYSGHRKTRTVPLAAFKVIKLSLPRIDIINNNILIHHLFGRLKLLRTMHNSTNKQLTAPSSYTKTILSLLTPPILQQVISTADADSTTSQSWKSVVHDIGFMIQSGSDASYIRLSTSGPESSDRQMYRV